MKAINNKTSLLIIAGDYTPNPSPNGVCLKLIVEELKHDIDITIISCNLDNRKMHMRSDGVNYVFVNSPCQYLSNVFERKKKNILFRIYRGLKNAFMWLGFSKWFYKKAYRQAIKLNEKNSFDAIFSVCYPFSGLFAGYKASKKLDIKHITYILDVYSEASNLRKMSFFMKKFKSKDIDEEKNVLNSAYVNFVSQGFIESKIAKMIPLNKCIEVGFPLINEKSEDLSINSNTKNIFIGSTFVMGVREPYDMINIFSKLEKLSLTICCKGDFEKDIDNLSKINKNVSVFKNTPKEFAMRKMQEADILLNISNENDHQIPSKIFEYFATCKPIINIYKTIKQKAIFEKYPLVMNINKNEICERTILDIEQFCLAMKEQRANFDQVQKDYEIYTNKYISRKVKETL